MAKSKSKEVTSDLILFVGNTKDDIQAFDFVMSSNVRCKIIHSESQEVSPLLIYRFRDIIGSNEIEEFLKRFR